MQAKALLIPIAAFALSATGVSAFSSEILEEAGLSPEQISAFETAQELRREGDKDGAREVLTKAGFDLHTMESVREAMHSHKDKLHTAIDEAVENNDYDAFKDAVQDSPLSDIITTQEDFALFSEAHELHKKGDHDSARLIMQEIGFDQGPFDHELGFKHIKNNMPRAFEHGEEHHFNDDGIPSEDTRS